MSDLHGLNKTCSRLFRYFGFEQSRLFAVLFVSVLCSASVGNTFPYRCMIAGCESRINDQKWKDYRIGFGITNLTAQKIFDTGLFTLIEEKPEMRERIGQLRSAIWENGSKKVLSEVRTCADSSVLILARLVYFGTPRTQMSFGPVRAANSSVVIRAEIDALFPGKKVITGKGSGSASKKARAALFEFRENKINFDQSEIGIALEHAIRAAVDDLADKIRKAPIQ